MAGSGRCGASWAASTATGTPRSCAIAMISASGGIQPVMLDAPVMASSRGAGRWLSAAATSAAPKVPSGPHSTYRQVAARDQGSMFAWCSATVVTTTSSRVSRSR